MRCIAIAVGGGLASSTPAGAMTAARYSLVSSAYELGSFTDLKTSTNEVEVIAPLGNVQELSETVTLTAESRGAGLTRSAAAVR